MKPDLAHLQEILTKEVTTGFEIRSLTNIDSDIAVETIGGGFYLSPAEFALALTKKWLYFPSYGLTTNRENAALVRIIPSEMNLLLPIKKDHEIAGIVAINGEFFFQAVGPTLPDRIPGDSPMKVFIRDILDQDRLHPKKEKPLTPIRCA